MLLFPGRCVARVNRPVPLASFIQRNLFRSCHSMQHQAGILAAEVYVPNRCVNQSDLEIADGVGAGKYTIGLGQHAMAFCDDREDINSFCLTALAGLLEKYDVNPDDIGRLEVGTETILDKSKSTKTTLMQLLNGNRNVEGATVINACYGGTAALLNSLAWVNSAEWDGRYAVVVAGDIAVYEAGPARPTGGGGAVALLIGRDAPLVAEPKLRHSHSVDVYDFFKPNLSSEYPVVDGKLSQLCYTEAIQDCYIGYMSKLSEQLGRRATTADFDHMLFHSPYNKLVRQSHALMTVLDETDSSELRNLDLNRVFNDKQVMKAAISAAEDVFEQRVAPSCIASQLIGNCYTASVYMNFAALCSRFGAALNGQRIGLFSYGSGAIATLMSFMGRETSMTSNFSLTKLQDNLGLEKRLASRRNASVDEFINALEVRSQAYAQAKDYVPVSSLDNLAEGTFYLERITPAYQRVYSRK